MKENLLKKSTEHNTANFLVCTSVVFMNHDPLCHLQDKSTTYHIRNIYQTKWKKEESRSLKLLEHFECQEKK